MEASLLFKSRYLHAVAFMELDRWEECIADVRHNLTDPNIPRYWRMKNMLLIAHALDDWYPAERLRLEIVGWYTHTERLCDPENADDQAALADLRAGLYELESILSDQAPDPIDRDRLRDGSDDGIEDSEDSSVSNDSDAAPDDSTDRRTAEQSTAPKVIEPEAAKNTPDTLTPQVVTPPPVTSRTPSQQPGKLQVAVSAPSPSERPQSTVTQKNKLLPPTPPRSGLPGRQSTLAIRESTLLQPTKAVAARGGERPSTGTLKDKTKSNKPAWNAGTTPARKR